MYGVITIGSATIDVFVNTHSDEVLKKKRTKEFLTCYPLGSKILIKKLKFTTGGGATNTAVSFSRLGLKTAYLGNIGNDSNGNDIIKEMKKERIDFIGTRSKDMTNYSVILDSIKHDRTILAYKDASAKLDYNRISKSKLKTEWFYLSSLKGKGFDTSIKLMRYAVKNNIKVAFNPSCYEVDEGNRKLRPLLKCTDILVFNRQEAGLLLRKKKETPIKKLLRGVRALGPKIVVITEGKKGAYCSDGINIYYMPGSKGKVVETTGAGDAFASSFVAGIAKGYDIEFSMRLAMANAQSVIQHYGAKNKLLKWKEALRAMKKCPKCKVTSFNPKTKL